MKRFIFSGGKKVKGVDYGVAVFDFFVPSARQELDQYQIERKNERDR